MNNEVLLLHGPAHGIGDGEKEESEVGCGMNHRLLHGVDDAEKEQQREEEVGEEMVQPRCRVPHQH